MPEAKQIISRMLAKTGKLLPAPAQALDQNLVEKMAVVVRHAKNESDLVFPDDPDTTIEDCFNIVASALFDALSENPDLVQAYKKVMPRASSRRARTPAKEAFKILELARASHRSVGDYNREVFARAGITPVAIATALRDVISGQRGGAAKDVLEAIKLINRMCAFDDVDRNTGSPVLAIQNVMPATAPLPPTVKTEPAAPAASGADSEVQDADFEDKQ